MRWRAPTACSIAARSTGCAPAADPHAVPVTGAPLDLGQFDLDLGRAGAPAGTSRKLALPAPVARLHDGAHRHWGAAAGAAGRADVARDRAAGLLPAGTLRHVPRRVAGR